MPRRCRINRIHRRVNKRRWSQRVKPTGGFIQWCNVLKLVDNYRYTWIHLQICSPNSSVLVDSTAVLHVRFVSFCRFFRLRVCRKWCPLIRHHGRQTGKKTDFWRWRLFPRIESATVTNTRQIHTHKSHHIHSIYTYSKWFQDQVLLKPREGRCLCSFPFFSNEQPSRSKFESIRSSPKITDVSPDSGGLASTCQGG